MSQLWEPLPYMRRASDFLYGTTAGGLPLQPGGRKTSITLDAFARLLAEGRNKKMLVVAPKRVCRMTWPDEIKKWSQFEHLRISVITGERAKREKALNADADIYAVNPENVKWLVTYLAGKPWPFDVVCIDELTRFKDSSSGRSKALRPNMKLTKRRWGLTGSLTANGYLDVFGQQLMLDDGASLGRFITRFRDQHFTQDFTGYVHTLRPGHDKIIAAKISPYWFDMDPADYSQLPEIADDLRFVELEPEQKRQYENFDRTSVLNLEGASVTAANAAALYNKLSQLANGAIYNEGGDGTYNVIHDAKLDALDDLAEELNGTPLLIGYEFKHDLFRMRERLAKRMPEGWVLPCFGGGYSDAQEAAWKDAWNRGELPFMAAHPQSAGHGLNLQEANACHVAWFGLTWSWELFDQFIRRVRRSGNAAQTVFNHMFIVPGTIDELKLTAVRNKLKTHATFMTLLAAYITGTGDLPMNETQTLPPGWTKPATRAPDANGTGVTAQAATPSTAPAEQQRNTVAPAGTETDQQRQKIRDSVAAFATEKAPQAPAQPPTPQSAQSAKAPQSTTKFAPSNEMTHILAMLADSHLALARVAEHLAKR